MSTASESGDLRKSLTVAGMERRDGAVQRVVAKRMRRPTWIAKRPSENGLERKVSSGTNLQLTVHL